MKVQPKGTATVVKRGRKANPDASIELAIRLLKKTTEEIPLTHIQVRRNDSNAKAKYGARIRAVALKLGKPVSISWTDGAKSSPVVSKANR
jgi:hypothetical protein